MWCQLNQAQHDDDLERKSIFVHSADLCRGGVRVSRVRVMG